jgi:hypothetical protein
MPPDDPAGDVEDVMSKIIMLIGGVALALAAPAMAAGSDNEAGGSVPRTEQPKPKAEQRFCVVSDVTGSRIAHKVCKTRKEWLAEDFDPLAK